MVVVCEIIIFMMPISIIAYVPKFFFGALLTFIGVDLMVEWLFLTRSRVQTTEYISIWATFIAINCTTLLLGMVIGILTAALLFIYSYSQRSHAKMISKGHVRSKVVRNFEERLVLSECCDSIVVIQLTGYIFFGSALRITQHVKDNIRVACSGAAKEGFGSMSRTVSVNVLETLGGGDEESSSWWRCKPDKKDTLLGSNRSSAAGYGSTGDTSKQDQTEGGGPREEEHPTECVVFDCTKLLGLDATATRSCFMHLKRALGTHGIVLVFAGLLPDIQRLLTVSGLITAEDEEEGNIKVFETKAEALEWSECLLIERRMKRRRNSSFGSAPAMTLPPIEKDLPAIILDYLTQPSQNPYGLSPQTWDKNAPSPNKKPVKDVMKVLENTAEYFTKMEFLPGATVFQQGSVSDHIYVMAKGECSMYRNNRNKSSGKKEEGTVRLLKVTHGGIFGELDFYISSPRQYSVSIEGTEKAVVYSISRTDYARMSSEMPRLAAVFQQAVLHSLSLHVQTALKL